MYSQAIKKPDQVGVFLIDSLTWGYSLISWQGLSYQTLHDCQPGNRVYLDHLLDE